MERLTGFEVLTFDCYGTLIDWETGLLRALLPLTGRSGVEIDAESALETFAIAESAQERETPELSYPEILARVYRRLALAWGAEVDDAACARFGSSVGDWPVFDDSAPALSSLRRHFKLVVLSNVDRASFAASARRLGVVFDAIYTAEDIGSYKPDPRNFEYMVRGVADELGIARDGILHTAQSLLHDHVPAQASGLATCWIDRRHDSEGWGATGAPSVPVRPDFRFRSMAEMAEAVERELAG